MELTGKKSSPFKTFRLWDRNRQAPRDNSKGALGASRGKTEDEVDE